MTFRKVQEVDRRDHIVHDILDLIRVKTLLPGNKLPAENELCERFGVSRTVIREAMQSLQAMGAITVQQGRGTYVSENPHAGAFSIWASMNAHRVGELFAVRSILEAEASSLAADNRSEDDLIAMERALLHAEESLRNTLWLEALDADIAFHRAVMRAASLPLLSEMLEVAIPVWMGMTSQVATERNRQYRLALAHKEHLRVYDAIKRNDPEQARFAMRTHLLNSCARRIENDRGTPKQ
ncbi:MAG: FadR/GntR family transcriptional regulator [Microvirga sp.]